MVDFDEFMGMLDESHARTATKQARSTSNAETLGQLQAECFVAGSYTTLNPTLYPKPTRCYYTSKPQAPESPAPESTLDPLIPFAKFFCRPSPRIRQVI